MQKYTNGILHMHINTLHGLHSHYASSFWTNFLQTYTKVEIKKNRRERSSTKHIVVLASDSLPKKLGCKKQNSFTTGPFVFSHRIYLTARGEAASKATVMHAGCSIHYNGIGDQFHHPFKAYDVNGGLEKSSPWYRGLKQYPECFTRCRCLAHTIHCNRQFAPNPVSGVPLQCRCTRWGHCRGAGGCGESRLLPPHGGEGSTRCPGWSAAAGTAMAL